MAGRDPRVAPNTPETISVLSVAEFLDRYQTNYVEAEGLKSAERYLNITDEEMREALTGVWGTPPAVEGSRRVNGRWTSG
jgi:hypothetical protein